MRAAILLLLATPALADEPSSDGAPPPGEESGRIDGYEERDSTLREVGRGLLVLPRAAFEIAMAPMRAGVWVYDRYQLRERWLDLFFNDARTIGLYPTVRFDSGFGLNAGARFVARDVFGEQEHVALRGAAGGRYRSTANATLRSGDRFGRLGVELAAEHERRPHDRYYGIGNTDEPETRYRQELVRASLVTDVRLVRDLHLRAAGALTDLEFGPGDDGTPIDQIYMPVGYDGLRYAYGDLELAWDGRSREARWESGGIDSLGWLAAVYGGRVAVERGPDFWRFGADAQHFLRITNGPRVIATRVHVEAVTGSVGEVPFDELPKLGGSTLLRGYPADRFRDRAAVLGTLEYRWDLAQFLVAHAFVDGGRVSPSVRELSVNDLRVGYGIGIDGYTENSFVLRASLSSSIDGGVFFDVSFDPAFDLDPRVRRR
jgi:hypothetical protein